MSSNRKKRSVLNTLRKGIALGRRGANKGTPQGQDSEKLHGLNERQIKRAMESRARRRLEVWRVDPSDLPELQPTEVEVHLKSTQTINLIRSTLSQNIIFNDCNKDQIDQLIGVMKPKKIRKDTTIIREMDEGFMFYVVESGKFKFTKKEKQVGDVVGAGSCFGELSLRFSSPRSVSVTCVEHAQVWTVSRPIFQSILAKGARENMKRVINVCRTAKLTKDLTDDQLRSLADVGHYQSFRKGSLIIQKGDTTNFLYIVIKGSVQIQPEGKLAKTRCVAGEYFGEVAILNGGARTADVVAMDDCDVLVLDKASVVEHLAKKIRNLDSEFDRRFLRSVPFLKNLTDDQFEEVRGVLLPEDFNKNKQLIKQGNKGNKFFIIKRGMVRVVKVNEDDTESKWFLSTGAHFGQLSLENDTDTRNASVYVESDTASVFSMTREQYRRYLPQNHDEEGEAATKGFRRFIKKDRTAQVSEEARNGRSYVDGLDASRAVYGKIKLGNLKKLKMLGRGGNAVVNLVKDISTNDTYAMKEIRIVDIISKAQEKRVQCEKNILRQCDHPFVLKLITSFQTDTKVKFLMEFIPGGDLFTHVHCREEVGDLSVKQVKFYLACIVEALDYLHKVPIMYRDLKLENLMLDGKGYIKVVDFGLAMTCNKNGRTQGAVGTKNYMAPEIFLNQGHGRAVDFWALGVVAFEMMTKRFPFSNNRAQRLTQEKKLVRAITRLEYKLPPNMHADMKNFIASLLQRNPMKRLGMGDVGADEIKKHALFTSLDWDKLVKKEIASPYVPELEDNTDVSHFDGSYDEETPSIVLRSQDPEFLKAVGEYRLSDVDV